MLQYLKKVYYKFIQRLPENKVRADYFEMLQKLKRLEGQVEARANQLEMAKSGFLRNLYHEIRTPLNAIIGFTTLLSGEGKLNPEDKAEYLEMVNQSSANFLKIMDDIIQASLIEAGMIKINSEALSLGEFMDTVYSFGNFRKRVLEKDQIALLKNIPSKLTDTKVVCDKHYLNQIMSQLVDNAIKFTERGTVEFGCDIKNQNIEFFVKDSGKGNINGKGKYIFGKFTKIDVADSSKNGLGIGLSNCKNLVELMNGKIWYTSKINKGTTFFFSIPFVEAKSATKKEIGEKNNLLNTSFGGQKSLVV